MELRQLRYFVTVAEELHFGRAAERLHVVQPAVSQQVARLERELGVQLLDRTPRRVRLTAEGTRLLAEARSVLAAAERTSAVAAQLVTSARTTMRITAGPALGARLEHALRTLRAGGVTVELVSVPIPEQVAAVARGEVDVAVTWAAQPTAGVRVIPLWREPLVVALPVWHEAAQLPTVALADLAGLPVRLPSEACDPVFRAHVLLSCRAAGLTPVVGRPSGSPQDTLVEIGAAARTDPTWTVLHAEAAHELADRLRSVALRPSNPPLEVPGTLVVAADKSPACVQSLTTAFGRTAPTSVRT